MRPTERRRGAKRKRSTKNFAKRKVKSGVKEKLPLDSTMAKMGREKERQRFFLRKIISSATAFGNTYFIHSNTRAIYTLKTAIFFKSHYCLSLSSHKSHSHASTSVSFSPTRTRKRIGHEREFFFPVFTPHIFPDVVFTAARGRGEKISRLTKCKTRI